MTGTSYSRLDVNNMAQLAKPDLLTMTGFFRIWMANHFGSPDTIVNSNLKQYVWNPDVTASQLSIESNLQWDPLQLEFRPAIIIKRGGWRPLRMGINNRLMGEVPGNLGKVNFASYWQGSHTLFVCGGEGGEVEAMAGEVLDELNMFAPKVQTELNLFRLEVAEVGEVAKLEEASENFVVPITMAYVLESRWQIDIEAPVLKRVYMSMLTQ